MTDARCELCGEPMPPGEEMFKYHGYSGPCPKDLPPKAATPKEELERQIMDSRVPKNEREHWAAAELEGLRSALQEKERDGERLKAECISLLRFETDQRLAAESRARTAFQEGIDAAAKVAEAYPTQQPWDAGTYEAFGLIGKGQDSAARDIAAAIRSLTPETDHAGEKRND